MTHHCMCNYLSYSEVCGSVLQCVAVCCSVFHHATHGMCNDLPYGEVCGSVWQCVAVCCIMSHMAVCCSVFHHVTHSISALELATYARFQNCL